MRAYNSVWAGMLVGALAQGCQESSMPEDFMDAAVAGDPDEMPSGGDGPSGSAAAPEAPGTGGEPSGMEGGADGDDSMTGPPVSFQRVYGILEVECAPCHTIAASGGLDMSSSAMAYAGLVNAAATGCGGAPRVRPGDPDGSLLIQALEGTAGCVGPMPAGRAPLPADVIAEIRRWIQDGAVR